MRKLNWKKIVAGTLSAVMLLSVTACGSSSTKSESASTEAGKKELTKVTFCLDWTPNTNHTGIYAAKALGYYEDAGLDVEIVQPPENGAATKYGNHSKSFSQLSLSFFLTDHAKCINGTRPCCPAKTHLTDNTCRSDQNNKNNIWNQKCSTAIKRNPCGKHPYISHANRRTDTGKDKSPLTVK